MITKELRNIIKGISMSSQTQHTRIIKALKNIADVLDSLDPNVSKGEFKAEASLKGQKK